MDVNAAAKLVLVPKGNQVAVITLLSFSAIFFAASVWLEYSGKSYGLSLSGAVVFLVFGSIAWWVSHKNEALSQSHPLTINMVKGDQSVAISSDARSLPEASYVQTVLSHWSALIFRKNLPEADGVVGTDGIPLPDTKGQAKVVVDNANAEADEQIVNAVKMFKAMAAQKEVEPPSPVVSVIDTKHV